MRPDKAQKNKKIRAFSASDEGSRSSSDCRHLQLPQAGKTSSSVLEPPAGISCGSRRSRFQLPVIPSATEMGSTTEHTDSTEGQALRILSHSECSGYSVVFQGIPRLSKVIQTTNPPPRPHRFPGSLSFRTQMHSSNQPLQTATWSDLRGCGVKQETN